MRRGLLLRALREGDTDRCRRSANRRRSNHRQCHVDNQGTGFNTGLFNFFSPAFLPRDATAVLATTVCALVHRRQNRDGCGYYESLGFTVHLQLFSDISARSYFKMGQRVLALQLEISDLASGTILGGTV